MSQIDQNKVLLGKILGEIYRIQSRMDIPHGLSKKTIYGLLNGFEVEIEDILQSMGYVSSQQVKAVINVLDSIRSDPQKLNEFKGFYDLEEEVNARGVYREELMSILTYFNANGEFPEFIEKMKGQHSPAQCKTFDLDEFNS
jgi:hypothetical protein